MLKLGRVRIKTDPAICQPGGFFTQRLDLNSGTIVIQDTIRVWVDANQPVIRIELDYKSPATVQVQHETWRKERRQLTGGELGSAYGQRGSPEPVWEAADTVLDQQEDRIVFFHRNKQSIWEGNLRLQALGEMAAPERDPLLKRTFGAIVHAPGLKNHSGDRLVSSAPIKQGVISIYPFTMQATVLSSWLEQALVAAAATNDRPLAEARAAHAKWWREFWERSWIDVEATGGAANNLPVNQHAWRVGLDSKGSSRFNGEIAGPRVLGRALSADEIARLAASPRSANQHLQEEPLATGCTVAAWIKPAAGNQGRVFDKCTVGKPDGFLFDTYPGLSLRWIVGKDQLAKADCLKAGEWQHVAATVDAATGERRIYRNGQLVQEVGDDPIGTTISRGYALQRWINACAGRGAFPIKFNGSIFTVDVLRPIGKHGPYDADYRAWGGGYWFQNTRLPYWSMLAAGDYDLMQPLFKMYLDALPLRKAATRKYYQHGGAFFPETMYFWGAYNNDNYGWKRQGKPDGLTDNQFIRYYWQGGLELTALMLDHYDATGDAAFRDNTLLPFSTEILTFFDQHWPRSVEGKLHLHPAMALETWWDATNPMPEIAGLHFVLPRLIEVSRDSKQLASWRKILADLPPIPVGGDDGERRLLPAEKYSNKRNFENPELYAVFPYRLYGVGKSDLELARVAYRRRLNRGTGGWFQNAIHAALLGLTDEAQSFVAANFKQANPAFRFPAMWGPNFDWVPDQDHGSVASIALQTMLLQTDGDKIRLLPAWPQSWNVSFKLHTLGQTTVEGKVVAGKVTELKVTPESRRKDVVIAAGK